MSLSPDLVWLSPVWMRSSPVLRFAPPDLVWLSPDMNVRSPEISASSPVRQRDRYLVPKYETRYLSLCLIDYIFSL